MTNPPLPNADELEVSELVRRLQGFETAYSEEFFTPLTEEEKAKVGGELRSRIAADMGRHLAKFFVEAASALSSAQAQIEALREANGKLDDECHALHKESRKQHWRAEAAEAEVKRLSQALELAQSNEERLLNAVNATDLSPEQKAFIADHLERSRPARTALSGGTSNG